MQLTQEQRTFVVETFFRRDNVNAVIEAFQQRFPERNPPTDKTIRRIISKFRNTGSVANQNSGRSGRRRTARTPENVARVQEAIVAANNQNVSISARRNGLGISSATFNRITKNDLNWHPYQMFIRHQLENNDFERRINFCQWLLNKFNEPDFLNKIVIGDEAAFSLNGKVNSHNVVMYAPKGQPPNFTYDVNSSREKVTVWAGICGNGRIIGPFFFDENINGNVYVNMLNEQVVPELNEMFHFNIMGDNRYEQNIWWFQDGAPCHRQNVVTERLRQLFGNQVVSLGQETEWPPRSPDLTPCDFFLWGYIKSRICRSPPLNIMALRESILQENLKK